MAFPAQFQVLLCCSVLLSSTLLSFAFCCATMFLSTLLCSLRCAIILFCLVSQWQYSFAVNQQSAMLVQFCSHWQHSSSPLIYKLLVPEPVSSRHYPPFPTRSIIRDPSYEKYQILIKYLSHNGSNFTKQSRLIVILQKKLDSHWL